MTNTEPSAQSCPTCHAALGKPCMTRYGYLRNERYGIHHARLMTEHGAWTLTYDREYRELPQGKRFQTVPYRKVA